MNRRQALPGETIYLEWCSAAILNWRNSMGWFVLLFSSCPKLEKPFGMVCVAIPNWRNHSGWCVLLSQTGEAL